MSEDLREFNGFINGRAGMSEKELGEVVERGQRPGVSGRFRADVRRFRPLSAESLGFWVDFFNGGGVGTKSSGRKRPNGVRLNGLGKRG